MNTERLSWAVTTQDCGAEEKDERGDKIATFCKMEILFMVKIKMEMWKLAS